MMEEGGYRIDILVTGYPGKSVCHGALGWSTIVLLRGHGRTALIDTGCYGVRAILQARLAELGVARETVSDLLLTHAHFDHIVNWPMFPRARIAIGGAELDWSLHEPWGVTPVPELHVREIARHAALRRLAPGDAALPGLVARAAPGHTPGHLVYVLGGAGRDLIFAGDAVKNRAELVGREADMTLDRAASTRTIEELRVLWASRTGSVLVPGHDRPMVLRGGEPVYLGRREAAIMAWTGDGLDDTTTFSLEA